MPVRATKRGAQRTPLTGSADVLICGASFAGLACARELAGCGAGVLLVDRYEIGERQTSACAAPTEWLAALGLESSARQTFSSIVVNTPGGRGRWRIPWSFSTFDYRECCAALWAQCGEARFETAKVQGIERGAEHVVHTDRGALRSGLVVDALGWRRMLGDDVDVTPPGTRMSRGLEVHPAGSGEELEIWLDPSYIPAGYSWCFPAGDERRIGVGSFEPRDHVREPTTRLAADLGSEPYGFQGNWIPHELRPAAADGIFFCGDSAGHCLPLTAEGIRTALYFGTACGRELRGVLSGERSRSEALERYGAFSAEHASAFRKLLLAQSFMSRVTRDWAGGRTLAPIVRFSTVDRVSAWFFRKYRDIAPPEFVAGDGVARHPPAVAPSRS